MERLTMEKQRITALDFTGVYRKPDLPGFEVDRIDLTELSGTNCYCDDDALREIRSRLEKAPLRGIHLLDSGNYHYVTKLWTDRLRTDYQLVVFDNHTDMQPPAFGGLLSCGGWICEAAAGPFLRRILLIGPDEEAWGQVDERMKRITAFVSRERLAEGRAGAGSLPEMKELLSDLPVYLSVDKDVLGEKWARTAWSQGELSLEELCRMLTELKKVCHDRELEFLGADICGESDPSDPEGLLLNREASRKLIRTLTEEST